MIVELFCVPAVRKGLREEGGSGLPYAGAGRAASTFADRELGETARGKSIADSA